MNRPFTSSPCLGVRIRLPGPAVQTGFFEAAFGGLGRGLAKGLKLVGWV